MFPRGQELVGTRYRNNIWHLPWTLQDVPHALVDINRECNIACRSCYNSNTHSMKSLKIISDEFETLLSMRRLSSVSIVGGEILLHPDLCEIIRLIKRRKIKVELFTNGVLLTPLLIDKIRDAGVDLIFVHIEPGQKRSDLPANASFSDIWKLIHEKTALIASRGIDAGIAMTVHNDTLAEMMEMIRAFLSEEYIHYFLLTLSRDGRVFKSIQGDIANGLQGCIDEDFAGRRTDLLNNTLIMDLLEDNLKLIPFACVGSNANPLDIRWISYVIGTINTSAHKLFMVGLKPSLLEKSYLWLHRLIFGRYPFYQSQNPKQFKFQLLLNAVTGGNFKSNVQFLRESFTNKGEVKIKRILFQNPADIDSGGNIIYCLNCPDAIIKNGHLVPVCIADKIE